MNYLNMRKSASFIAIALTSIALMAPPSFAAGSSDYSSTPTTSSAMKKINKAIKAEDFSTAYKLLSGEVKTSPKDADIHNLLGFSARKMGNYEESESHYTRALELDPKHKGALEYMGELYLTLNQPEKTEALRARLDDVCWLGCDELDDLDAAIAAWQANNG